MFLRGKGTLKGRIKQKGTAPVKNITSSNQKKTILRLGENSISFQEKERGHRGECLAKFWLLTDKRKEKDKVGLYQLRTALALIEIKLEIATTMSGTGNKLSAQEDLDGYEDEGGVDGRANFAEQLGPHRQRKYVGTVDAVSRGR